jgi:hypothetical protein
MQRLFATSTGPHSQIEIVAFTLSSSSTNTRNLATNGFCALASVADLPQMNLGALDRRQKQQGANIYPNLALAPLGKTPGYHPLARRGIASDSRRGLARP